MSRRASFTEAELARAWKVAQKHGAVLEVQAGTIRLLPASAAPPQDDDGDDDEVALCDKAFGVIR